MSITLITKNSTVASKRPTAAQLVAGELGLNLEATDPGLYFEDSAGNIRKVGGAHYGATAPNSTPAGDASLSIGELWYDTSSAKLRVWDGALWTIAGGSDTQAFYLAGPWATGVNRPDGQALLAGDEWYDTSTTPATRYVWDGLAWSSVGSGLSSGPVAPTSPAIGDLWYDTANLTLNVWTGAKWASFENGNSDIQTAAVAPTLRSNGGALLAGDLWLDPATFALKVWDSGTSTWVYPATANTAAEGVRALAAAPLTRADGSALQAGDMYYNTTESVVYVYDGLAWEGQVAGTMDLQTAAVAPTTRSTGATLVEGDLYYDTVADAIHAWNGTAWVVASGDDTHAFTGAGDPIITNPVTLRPNGSALQNGDIYIDTTSSTGYYYNLALTTWSLFGSDTHSFVASVAPTLRPNGTALVPGDQWYNSGDGRLYIYYFDGVTSQWVDASPDSGATYWQRVGTTLLPVTAGDTVAVNDGTVDTVSMASSGQVFGVERTITGTWDLLTGNNWTVGAAAIPQPTNGAPGQTGTIRLTAAPTSWPAAGGTLKYPGGVAPAPTSFPAIVPFYVQDSVNVLLGKPTEGIV